MKLPGLNMWHPCCVWEVYGSVPCDSEYSRRVDDGK
jgi:hypothetical protein